MRKQENKETDFVYHKIGFFDIWCGQQDLNLHVFDTGP